MPLFQRSSLLLVIIFTLITISDAHVAAAQESTTDEKWSALSSQAEKGDITAAFRLGYHFAYANEPDTTQAEQYLMTAAESEHLGAQLHLGTLYYTAFEDSPRTMDAYKWWHKAAQQGDARAQYLLALLYYQDAALNQDILRAYAWLQLAAEQALPEALAIREEMAQLLTPHQQRDAARLSTTLLSNEVEDTETEGSTNQHQTTAEVATQPSSDTPPATPPANSAQVEKANAQLPTTGHYVQIAAGMDEASTNTAREQWQQRHASQLPEGITAFINPSVRNDGRLVYRLQLGPFADSSSANVECARLKSQGQDCFVGRLNSR